MANPQPDDQLSAAGSLSRRELLAYTAAFGGAFLASQGLAADSADPSAKAAARPRRPPSAYEMKKSINLWALPYPQKMKLKECFQLCKDAGFEAVEVNYALDGDLSPEAGESDIRDIGKMARKIGLEISGVCSFLFWPYSLTHEDPKRRERGMELATKMIRAAKLLATENVLIVPGATYIPWLEGEPSVPFDVCNARRGKRWGG